MSLRVIQWATGGVGVAAIKGVLEHPDLELVGCWVHSKSKSGKDVGEIIGTDPVGVTATDSVLCHLGEQGIGVAHQQLWQGAAAVEGVDGPARGGLPVRCEAPARADACTQRALHVAHAHQRGAGGLLPSAIDHELPDRRSAFSPNRTRITSRFCSAIR